MYVSRGGKLAQPPPPPPTSRTQLKLFTDFNTQIDKNELLEFLLNQANSSFMFHLQYRQLNSPPS